MIPTLQVAQLGRSSLASSWLLQWANVRAMLHGEGANNSTTIVDSSTDARVCTATGNAKISTSQFKYGSASISFDASANTWVSIADSASITLSGDFALGCWVYFASDTGSNQSIISLPGSNVEVYRRTASSNALTLFKSGSNSIIGGTTLNTGQWYFVVWARLGTTQQLWLNGVSQGTSSDATSYDPTGIRLGAYTDGSERLSGNVDDFFASVGYNPFVAAFTPPSMQLPDS